MKTARVLTVIAITIVFASPNISRAAAMGTAFTYQGHLYEANYPANGQYDFSFKLFSDPSAGGQIGDDVNVAEVNVIDAYFTVELDFGSSAFDGDALWLEIGIRQGNMDDPNGYTTLSPRQELTPTPYALSVRAPLELLKVTDEPVLGVINAGQGYAIAAAAGVKPAVGGICLSNGNYGTIGDVNGAVYGLAGANSNAGCFEGDVALKGDLVVADGNRIHFEHNGTILFNHDANVQVLNDRDTYINRNDTLFINGDIQTTVGYDETRTVAFNRTTTVGGSDSCIIVNDWDIEAYGDAIIEANDIMLKGNVGIGDIAPSTRLDVDSGVRFRKLPTGTGTSMMITSDGYVIRFGSSKRYKEDIREFKPDTEGVLSLRPVLFKYKDTGQEDIGLIAEEVAERARELVIYDNQGRPDAVKYDRISLYLLDAVRELKKENEQLKEKIIAIEKNISHNNNVSCPPPYITGG